MRSDARVHFDLLDAEHLVVVFLHFRAKAARSIPGRSLCGKGMGQVDDFTRMETWNRNHQPRIRDPQIFVEKWLVNIKLCGYTQMHSKVGNLARRPRNFLDLERTTIAEWQGVSEDQKFAAKPTQPKTNF